jgi:hypothetical protein
MRWPSEAALSFDCCTKRQVSGRLRKWTADALVQKGEFEHAPRNQDEGLYQPARNVVQQSPLVLPRKASAFGFPQAETRPFPLHTIRIPKPCPRVSM